MSFVLPDPFPPPWASEWEEDAEWGLAATLNLNGVKQTFRWIQPGTFLMGSSKGKPQRMADQKPQHQGTLTTQHQVTLTRGYWLADTACTQALWQAVMGDNPSFFKDDPASPVEQVSWNDVQTCLDRLNALVPGLEAGLPSEAQWEGACRAGTTMPFSFGENITPKRSIYDSKFYEWCADWYGDYPPDPQIDPSGPPKGVYRVLRGGSWGSYGQDDYSAPRRRHEPDEPHHRAGFRLAPGQRPGPAGQETARPAAERAGQAAGSDAGG